MASCDIKQGRSQDFSKGGRSHWVKQYRHGVFAPEYCRLFAKKKVYKAGGGGVPQDPPSYAPVKGVTVVAGCSSTVLVLNETLSLG